MAQPPAPIGTPKESGLFPRNGNRPSADDSESDFKPYRGNDSLSVDFSTPLTGVQRGEKVQQMVKSHPTWQTAEQFQKLLYKASTTIRRMPGVASNESQEVSDQLQQIGQIVTRDTVRLVEEHAKITLDYQDTEKAVGRLSLENNLAKADMEQRVAKFDQLYSDYVAEREKREQYESDIQTITKYLRSLSNDLRGFQAQATAARDACPENERSDIDHLLQDLQNTITVLDTNTRTAPCRWSHSGNGVQSPQNGTSNNDTALGTPSKVLVRREGDLPLSPADKAAITEKLKELGCFNPNADISLTPGRPLGPVPFNDNNQASNSLVHLPRTPANTGALRPPISFQPPFVGGQAGRPGSTPGPGSAIGHNYTRSRGSSWGTSGPGPRSRSVSINSNIGMNNPLNSSMNNSMTPFNGQHARRSFGQQGKYRSNGSEYHQNNSFYGSNDRTPPPRPGTAFDGNTGYRRHTPRMSGGRGRGGSRGLQDPFVGNNSGLPGNNNGFHMSSSSSPAVQLTEQCIIAWQGQVRAFYQAIHTFVETFGNVDLPEGGKEALIKAGLWDMLLKVYQPLSPASALSYLEFHIQNHESRFCLITRLIIDFVVNLVWIPGAWKGANAESTTALIELENELGKSEGLPAFVRQPLLDRQATIIDNIMRQNDGDSEFYRKKLDRSAGTLLTNLQPLLDIRANPQHAYERLKDLIKQAYDLSSMMLTSRLNFDCRFPQVGSRFSTHCMTAVWPTSMDALELQAKHWRVALVTTPVITCRNDTGNDISAHAVANADVYCMQ